MKSRTHIAAMRMVLPAILLLAASACKEEAETTFARMPARFSVANVLECPPLYTAVNNMGQWCTVQGGKNTYVVRGASETVERPLTSMTNYQGMYLGIAGLIIGLPNIPDMGNDVPTVKCYDLACPNCYDEVYIGRALTVDCAGGVATCGRCGRTYNLNSLGVVTSEGGGTSLFRYRVNCNGQQLLVSN